MYISIDANNIGKIIEGYILSNELKDLSAFSTNLTSIINEVNRKIKESNGSLIMSGGDNILAEINELSVKSIIAYVQNIEIEPIRFSIGLGDSAISSFLALKYAKAKKIHNAVLFNGSQFINYC